MATAGQLYSKKPVPAVITFASPDDPEQPVATINVTYYPQRVTPKLMRQITATDDVSEKLAGLVSLVCRWVATWDLTEDDGTTPVPLTPERLEEFDAEVLDAIITQLGQDQQAPNGSAASLPRDGSRGSLV